MRICSRLPAPLPPFHIKDTCLLGETLFFQLSSGENLSPLSLPSEKANFRGGVVVPDDFYWRRPRGFTFQKVEIGLDSEAA